MRNLSTFSNNNQILKQEEQIMKTLKLGYATKNRETDRFLYEHKNIVRMETTPDAQTIVFAYKHVPQDSPNFIWYSDPRPNGYGVSESMLRLIATSAAAATLGSAKSPKKTASSRENGKKGGRPFKGYRLHWEGSTDEPTAFRTMKEVRAEIRRGAKEGEITIAQAEKIAYVITEKEYQESLEQ
jgi:hypothetical protein